MSLRPVLFICTLVAVTCSSAAAEPNGPTLTASQGRIQVQGVLISTHARSALINGVPTREGEQVDGAELVAVNEDAVTLRKGGYELLVVVGGSGSWSRATRRATIQHAAAEPADARGGRAPSRSEASVLVVAQGDTLSTIAERHLAPGVGLGDMMLAIYQANPAAFAGDIHQLRAGATLELPSRTELAAAAHIASPSIVAPYQSAAENSSKPPNVPAQRTLLDRYGPVESGDSLSAIAAQLGETRFSREQLMMAIFVANPKAFGANINVLYAGVTLTLPNADEVAALSPELASIEVARHAEEWRSRAGAGLIARSPINPPHTEI